MLKLNCQDLLDQIFKANVHKLSQQDKTLLLENREEVIHNLLPLLSKEMTYLLEEDASLDPNTLLYAYRLAAFLKASECFEWLQKLGCVSVDTLDKYFGPEFIMEEWPYLLSQTADHNWEGLKSNIQDKTLEQDLRFAYLKAFTFIGAQEEQKRQTVMSYFKHLFIQILNGHIEDEELLNHLIMCSNQLWPGECLEEIREIYGLCLVDNSWSIFFVLDKNSLGKERCLEKLREEILSFDFFNQHEDHSEIEQANINNFFTKINEVMLKIDQFLTPYQQINRNDLCFCGSGKKYKKCCINSPAQGRIKLEISTISYEPIDSEGMDEVLNADKSTILGLYNLCKDDPEQALKISSNYIKKYPQLPMLYNYLYIAYRMSDKPQQAIKVLKETVRLFPNYLFALVEYILYLLRRGEVDKVSEVLKNANTLSQLYPKRDIFHVSELKSFSYAMASYQICLKDFDQAKVYLEILRQISQDSPEAKKIEKDLRRELFVMYTTK